MDHPFLDHPFLDNPFLDKQYGTDDASYFALPEQLSLEPGVRAVAVTKQLNQYLRITRTASLKLQQELAIERAAQSKNIPTYGPHDLILFNMRKQPSDHLETRLSLNWLGPYEVVYSS